MGNRVDEAIGLQATGALGHPTAGSRRYLAKLEFDQALARL